MLNGSVLSPVAGVLENAFHRPQRHVTASLIRTVIDFACRSNARGDLAGVVRSLESDRNNRVQDRHDQDHEPDKPEAGQ